MKKSLIISIIIALLLNICSPIIFATNELDNNIAQGDNEKETVNESIGETINEENKDNEEENNNATETDNMVYPKITKSYTRSINNVEGRFCIDTPIGNLYEGKSITINGWLMSTDSNASMKIYIDGVDAGATITKRIEREDVLELVKGYGGRETNPKPGFEIKIDLTPYEYKNYEMKYVLIDGNDREITSRTKTITIDSRTKGRFCIDTPSGNVYEGKSITTSGWLMSTDENARIKIYINGQEVTPVSEKRIEREDVINAVTGYGGRESNPKPGFEIKIDLTPYEYKNYEIKYVLIDGNNREITSRTKTITIDSRTKGRICMDTPSSAYIEENYLAIEGWAMCNEANASIKIYIDDEDTNSDIQRASRPDVLNAVSGYGGIVANPTPGFKTSINIENYEKGKKYNLKIKLLSEDGDVVTTVSKNIIFYSNDKGRLCLDIPTRTVFTGDNVTFVGWEMSQLPDSVIKLYVDGNEAQVETIRTQRSDVIAAVSQTYGGIDVNPNPGFEITLNIKKYSQGSHTVTLKLYSKEGKLLATKNKLISVVKDIYFGIDVSKWQYDINWQAVKQEGVNYSIIRIGYGQTLSNKDKFFEANYNSCVSNRIPVGVYTYSYALNVEEAKLEAYAVLNWLRNNNGTMKNLQLPVFWDTEDKCQAGIDRNTLTAMADTFCSIIEEAGYQAGIYGSKNWLNTKLNMNALENKYDIWVAQYYRECTYEGRYDIWQYSSEERLSGINGNVDCNWFYKKY